MPAGEWLNKPPGEEGGVDKNDTRGLKRSLNVVDDPRKLLTLFGGEETRSKVFDLIK